MILLADAPPLLAPGLLADAASEAWYAKRRGTWSQPSSYFLAYTQFQQVPASLCVVFMRGNTLLNERPASWHSIE